MKKLTSLSLLILSSFMPFVSQAEDKRPNIVVILSDDSGYTDLGSFGGEIETPNLDQLAQQGMRFSRFYSNARCSPTRASLLTGVDAAHVGFGGGVVGDWVRELPFEAHRARLPYDQPLISEMLGSNGYQTLMAGKWHLGGSYIKENPKKLAPIWRQAHSGMELTEKEMELDYLGLPPQRGFQQSFVFHGAQGNLFVRPEDGHEYYEGNQKATLKYDYNYKMRCYAGGPFEQKHYGSCDGKSGKAFYATDGMTDRAIDMIEEASEKTEPFFMYVAYRAPHKPLQAPEELVQKYLKRYSDLQKIADERHKGLVKTGLFSGDVDTVNNNYMWTKQDPEKIEKFRLQSAVHAAMMEKLDENVGKLVQGLKDSGEYDNTLIFYFSDNGAASHIGDLMNVPYKGVKALLWEGGARTHAIASWPGVIKPGTMSDDLIWVGDITPTLLEITNTEFPEKFRGKTPRKPDGRSVISSIKGEPMTPPEAIYFNDKGQQSVIYQGRWKLLVEAGWYLQTLAKPGIAYELYDLDNDPGETNNLADKKPEMVKKLLAMSEKWKAENKIVDYAEIIKIKPNDPY
ncbi:sulfatase-like hydrolase/transferase [Echinimonas agarilytica]|uniref:Sulfatase-like hydrolase/transferase n=1 Tax=Echinimonas agarilytica TaxID=1215918 RepID=A0AA42B696_9GAMM|nr:sulfatase-like hydrolase/transferase [Echinimonas agarilytica]MCM2678505.1 sulfatase-like hydrolase/transferase [Echinimonas agarilytica]